MADETARFIAGKVKRGIIRACSVAFVPIPEYATRRGTEKAEPWSSSSRPGPGGWDFHAVEMTELSLVGVGANPRALLESTDIPSGVAKSLRRVCLGGKCFTKWAPERPAGWQSVLESVKAWGGNIQQMQAIARDMVVPSDHHQIQVLLSLLRSHHEARKILAEHLPQIKAQEPGFQKWVMDHSAQLRQGCHAIVAKIDELHDGQIAKTAAEEYQGREALSPRVEEPNGRPSKKDFDESVTPDNAEILARYGPDDMTPEEMEDLLDRYRLPPGFGIGADPNSRRRR
jgi:hypothetical protein